jgi:ABC-2 type transport system permease protein
MSASVVSPAATISLDRHPNSDDREAQLFRWIRFCMVRTRLLQVFRKARLRTTLVAGLSLLFWAALYVLFYQGFYFIGTHVGDAGGKMHADTIRLVFHMFFASLNLMLVFSAGIIFFGAVYRSPEMRLLLSLPVRDERIALHKFQEALLYSCWGFFLLASPMMLAYGVVVHAPWYYYVLMVPMIVSFVYVPCAIGSLCCMILVSKAPRLKLAIVATLAVASILLASRAVWVTVSGPQTELFGYEWFQETKHRFAFTQQMWLPSSWLSNGMLEAARRVTDVDLSPRLQDSPVVQSCMYLALLVSNALLGDLLLVYGSRRWLRKGYSLIEGTSERKRSTRPAMVDSLMFWLVRPFPHQVQLLLHKDWRLLRRDPLQWSQFLIFFGLLGLYFLNLDRFSHQGHDISNILWVNMVSFLNLAVVGLILSTFTTRFIYPMISLEGQRFWVLGLLPLPRTTILWSKFLFAALGSWIPCALLILASDLMLQIDPLVLGVHQFTCLLLCLGLASIAVGIGAMMPDFRESSPSKIAAGFGGTLTLVISALYIIVIVVCTALPCHFYLIAGNSPIGNSLLPPDHWRFWMAAGVATALVTGTVTTVVPLVKGLKAFQKLELA